MMARYGVRPPPPFQGRKVSASKVDRATTNVSVGACFAAQRLETGIAKNMSTMKIKMDIFALFISPYLLFYDLITLLLLMLNYYLFFVMSMASYHNIHHVTKDTP